MKQLHEVLDEVGVCYDVSDICSITIGLVAMNRTLRTVSEINDLAKKILAGAIGARFDSNWRLLDVTAFSAKSYAFSEWPKTGRSTLKGADEFYFGVLDADFSSLPLASWLRFRSFHSSWSLGKSILSITDRTDRSEVLSMQLVHLARKMSCLEQMAGFRRHFHADPLMFGWAWMRTPLRCNWSYSIPNVGLSGLKCGANLVLVPFSSIFLSPQDLTSAARITLGALFDQADSVFVCSDI